MNARCAPKSCQNSPKPARFSPKIAHIFRCATHRMTTKITIIHAGTLCGPSVDRAHNLQSLRACGAPILRKIQRKIHQNRAVFAEKSAQIGAKRAPNVRHKRKNNHLMVSEIFKAMQMPLRSFCEPCARIARENSAEIHRNPRGSRRKFARIFVAQRTARSHNAP